MRVIVLVKEVPDTESLIEMDDGGRGIQTEDVKWVLNPYDEYAVEAALQLREEGTAVSVTAVSAGPPGAEAALRTTLAMGVDAAVRIEAAGECLFDAEATATLLSRGIEELGCELIFAGMRGIDGDRYQVPARVASKMAVPLISPAASFSVAEGVLAFTAETEEGTVSGKTSPPAVIVARKGMNTPRYPSVRARMAARKKEIVVKHPADSVRSSPKTRLLSMAPPPARTPGRIIEAATPEEKAEKLIDLLAGEAGVL